MIGVVTPQAPAAHGAPLEPARALEQLGQLARQLDSVNHEGVLDPDLDLGAERLQYVSPEQILGRPRGLPSDVYSLSAVLYRHLTGTVPFPDGHGRALFFWHLHAPRPRPTAVRPDLPAAIDAVIERGMATDPAARPPTPGALIEEARSAFGLGPAPEHSRRVGAPAPPEPVPLAAPPKRAGVHIGLLAAALMLAVAAAAGAAGFLVPGAPDDASPPAVANAGPLQLRAPADWGRPGQSPLPSSMRLAAPLVLAPLDSSDTRLVAGLATPADAVATLSSLGASPPSGELVSLGGVQARRYRDLKPPGATTLYVAPTEHGVATVACVADRAAVAASFMQRCESVAVSVDLPDGRFLPVGPNARQTQGQARVFRRLNAARSRYRARVRRSKTGTGLADAALELALVHARAARVLRSLELSGIARPGGVAAVRALERAAGAYRSLGATADAGNRRGYARARRSALAADAALRRGLRMLRLVGYAA